MNLKKDKIRILFTLSELMYGSKTRQLVDLVNGLDRNLFEIEIVSSVIGDEATDDILALNVPVHAIRLYPPHQLRIAAWWNFAISLFKLNKQYDIVHSLHYSSFFYEALIVKLFTKAKYIYSKSNPEWDNHPFCWKMKSVLADRIVAGSNLLKELLYAKGFGAKVQTIFYGIDTDYFIPLPSAEKTTIREKVNIPKDYFVFGCAAQFLFWKNHSLLICAFSKLVKKYNKIFLVLCGQHYNDKCYKEVNDLIHREGLEGKVKYLGVLPDMREFYNAIDCFVLPSNNEAFGLVYAEAMSSSIPVIGVNLGGPKDIISERENGFLIEPNDMEGFVEVMEKYLKESGLAGQHGIIGRKRAIKYFSKKVTVSQHNQLYQSIINNDGY